RDRNNNVERIRVASPAQGIYTLNVTGYSVTVGPQPYAIAMTGDLTKAVGKVYWEQEFVPANGSSADLVLLDSNLTNSGWAHVQVNSTTDRTGEVVNLTEIKAGTVGTGIFRGSVKVVEGSPAAGEVSVSSDEWVTVTYRDSYPSIDVTARIRALVQVDVANVTHYPMDHLLTYQEKVTVKIGGTPGWESYYDVVGLPGGKTLPARDDGVSPDERAGDGNYTGQFTIPNLVVGNFTLRGYIKRDHLEPMFLDSDEPVRINTNVPRKPSNLTVISLPQGNTLRLDWDSPGDINLMSFRVYRAVETFPGSGQPGQFSYLAETPDNRTYHVDTGLVDGTLYFYRVASFNILGYTSERTPPVRGTPEDTMYPWFHFNSPKPGSVLSGMVEFNYSLEEDARYILFQGAPDPDNDTVPDGPWVDILNDTSPNGATEWDTKCCEAQLPEGPGFVIRAITGDEANNVNVTSVLGIFTIDNTPPSMLEIASPLRRSQNYSVYHMYGYTEPFSRVIISRNSIVVRDLRSDERGYFEAFLTLEDGVNSWDVMAFDRYGNGPILFRDEIYIVLDDMEPVASVTYSDPLTSVPLVLDASGSHDDGPISELSGIKNFTWTVSYEDELKILYGAKVSLHVDRPVVASVILEVRDASDNLGTWSAEIIIVDDIPPVVGSMDDLNIFEDSQFQLMAPYVSDNDPRISSTGTYLWKISGPVVLEYVGREVSLSVATPGEYNVTLVVTDTGGGSGESYFDLKVIDITPPVPYAGEDITVIRGRVVNLSAFGTTDNDPLNPEGYNYTWNVKNLGHTFYGMNVSFRPGMLGEHGILLKVSDRAGNVEFTEIRMNVVTDGTPPVMIEVDPSDGFLLAPVDPRITIKFSEPIDQASIWGSAHLIGPGGLSVPTTIEMIGPDTIGLEVNEELSYGEEYRIRVTSSLKDLSGEAFIFSETTFRVRDQIRVLTVQGMGVERIVRDGLSRNGGTFKIHVVFNVHPQEDPVMTVSGPDSSTFEFRGNYYMENLTWVVEIVGLDEGIHVFTIDLTSSYGDPMDEPVVFSILIEKDEEPSPIVNSSGSLLYAIIAGISLLVLIILTAALLLIRRSRGRSPEHQEKHAVPHKTLISGEHHHEHAPVLDPAHPVHHHHPDHSHDHLGHDPHHYHPHTHLQHDREGVGFDQGTRNMK
ncbi:MAG: Ig-like domain-containing protein, partial [Thermoplasmatota archaeon]